MNHKSIVFLSHVKDLDPSVLDGYHSAPSKPGTFVFQISDKGEYFKSFTYSILSYLKNTNIRDYFTAVIVYGPVTEAQDTFYSALEKIGVAVYRRECQFLSKANFLFDEYNFKGRIVFLDVDTYVLGRFDMDRMFEADFDYAVSPTRVMPVDIEKLVEWKTGMSVVELENCLAKHPLLSPIQLGMDLWVGGYCVSVSERFHTDDRVIEILRFLRECGIESDEIGFALACRSCGYSVGPLGVDVYLSGNLQDVLGKENVLTHWSPLFDNHMTNGEVLNGLYER